MTDNNSVIICSSELENGYIFKGFFEFNFIRARPTLTLMNERICAGNRTADDQIYGAGYLYGDEINLVWNPNIPEDQRHVSLTYEGLKLHEALAKINKKDPARLIIGQIRNYNNKDLFLGPNSSDEFVIYVSSGIGGIYREGLVQVGAVRTQNDMTVIKYPIKSKCSLLTIPVKQFKRMITSYSKYKKGNVVIKYYTNDDVQGIPGITIRPEGSNRPDLFEKYGHVPDKVMGESSMPHVNFKIDEKVIVRINTVSQSLLEIEKLPEPNEFIFNADKIIIFSKIASMHNEGNICFRYQEGHHLWISYRFGAFGQSEILLYNSHVRFDISK